MVEGQQEQQPRATGGVGQRLLASNYRIAIGVLVCAMVVITWRELETGGLHQILQPQTMMGPLLAIVTELYFYISARRKQRRDIEEANHEARLGAALVGSACGVMLLAPWVSPLLPHSMQITDTKPLYWVLFGYLSFAHLAFACFYRGDGVKGPG